MSETDPKPPPRDLDPEKLMKMAMEPEDSLYYSDGSSFTPPEPGRLAELLPGFEILELIGRGGMGAVYKAVQRKLDRVVAIKVLPSEVARDPAFTERFGREARTLARLNHPHIVTVHDFGEADGLYYLVMEYVEGLNLRQLLSMGRLSPEEALRIVPQICDALQYAHEQGVVHRDIKPENVLIDQQGLVHIADFGLARLLGQDPKGYTLTLSQQRLGTPHYMAPEQIEDPSHVDHRADIFSLGVVFYEMLTGKLPLGRFDPPSSRSAVGPRVDEAVMRSLEREPGRRFQAASAMKSEIQEAWKEGFQAGHQTALGSLEAAGSGGGGADRRREELRRPPHRSRLSLMALFGFLWLTLGGSSFLLLWLSVGGEAGEPSIPSEFAAQSAPALGSMLIALLCGSGLLGGPILSLVAIGRIRRSRGQLYGMPLAVFTAWCVPLAILNALLLGVLGAIAGPVPHALVWLTVLIMLGGDIWFLVWFNRRMCEDIEGDAAPAGPPSIAGWIVVVLLLLAVLFAASLIVLSPGAPTPR